MSALPPASTRNLGASWFTVVSPETRQPVVGVFVGSGIGGGGQDKKGGSRDPGGGGSGSSKRPSAWRAATVRGDKVALDGRNYTNSGYSR